MKRLLLTLTCAVMCAWQLSASRRVTLDDCVAAARDNYPLIAKYGLLKTTADISLDEINTAWLPRAVVTAQVSWQNAVPTFPSAFSGMLAQTGVTDLRGIPRWQYRAGVELSQTVYDGGATALRRDLERSQAAVQTAALDVELYALRERVENLYFGSLLMQDQTEQMRQTHHLLLANLERLQVLVANGTALQADADMIEAQALTAAQQIVNAATVADGYRRALGLLTGLDLQDAELSLPEPELPADLTPDRPELHLLAARRTAAEAARNLNDAAVLPKVGLFAQGFYGMPGLDNFKSMTDRTPSFNFIGGVRLTWTLDSYYNRGRQRRRADLQQDMLRSEAETTVRNLDVQCASQLAAVEGLRRMSRSDGRIVELRTAVRQTAEAQLTNGVIDATALLAKITDENTARLNECLHRIQLAQQICRLKFILNR